MPTNVIIPGFLTSFISQYWAPRYRARWFDKYLYVLSSALDAGTSINALAICESRDAWSEMGTDEDGVDIFGLSTFVGSFLRG
jgi:hypothetical protein